MLGSLLINQTNRDAQAGGGKLTCSALPSGCDGNNHEIKLQIKLSPIYTV